jgi:biopolymer transport protein ExbB
MNDASTAGLLGLFGQADAVGKGAALVLLVMSVLTWYLIFTKGWQGWRERRAIDRAAHAFWNARDPLAGGTAAIVQAAPLSPCRALAEIAIDAARRFDQCADEPSAKSHDKADFLARVLRRGVQRAGARLDAGLSVLASIGATAPFVGLFGTVWGIYRALLGIGFTGQATIDKVAGPVGEALFMTAFGIAVAVPAVIAYNGYLRVNRGLIAELDGFAQDLHAFLMTGVRLGAAARDPACGDAIMPAADATGARHGV